jgi:hypothetical protein
MTKDELPPYFRPGIDDVQQMDELGEVDLEQIKHNLSLTPEERFEQYFDWLAFVELVREAGRRHYGAELWEQMREAGRRVWDGESNS